MADRQNTLVNYHGVGAAPAGSRSITKEHSWFSRSPVPLPRSGPFGNGLQIALRVLLERTLLLRHARESSPATFH